jgi:hypothetical protein
MHPIDHDIAVTLPANRHNYSVVASPLEQDQEEEEEEEVPEATKSPSVFFPTLTEFCFEVALNHKMAFC